MLSTHFLDYRRHLCVCEKGMAALIRWALAALVVGLASSWPGDTNAAGSTCYYSGNMSQGGTAVYYSSGNKKWVWTLNNNVFSNSSASTVSYGGQTYQRGSYRTKFSGQGYSVDAYELCVVDLNTAPTVANTSLSTVEDVAASIQLSASDPDAGDSHTFTIVSSNPAHGTAYISGKTLTFTPAQNWNGTTSLTYKATDSDGADSNIATITVTVAAVNDAPVAQAKTLTIDEDTSGSITLTATDIDSPAPTVFQIVTAANSSHGSAAISGSTLTFTPAPDWNGSTSLTYRAQDSSGAWSAPAVVTIIVRPVNDPPAVAGRSITTAEDTPATLTLSASDIDSSSFAFEIVSQPGHGFASIFGEKLTYNPPEDWYGTTSLTYRAKDDAGAWSNVATITITVSPVNDPPVAAPITLTLPEDTPGDARLIATDIDSIQSFVFELVTPPPANNGTAAIQGDRLLFTPAQDWHGTTTLTYRARDPEGDWSIAAVVTVVINPVNDQPTRSGKLVIRTTESIPAVVKGLVTY
ncbi:Ig-like domain-containing protein [Pseudomonas aeruginosa]|uniref:Ig-like domain-containing protein n=1 Tax=Pseudomonas aeruginosa TaxID=287 RepID=UPI002B278529|nr:Ig-like domain-containing protein [Pseudomonas aeruginosa]MEA8593055.1 Ig-like domain-containing protein [Pseudomonas aeruginosa]